MNQKILLANDLTGYGKVSMSAMMPVLSNMGYELFFLPTAIVSNTLDYGDFSILDTTAYIESTLAVWQRLGFSFDCVCTGMIFSTRVAQILRRFTEEQKRKGVLISVDPIMADNGSLYNGVTNDTVEIMRTMCKTADIITPNLTEAQLLCSVPTNNQIISKEKAGELTDSLKKLTKASIVITGCTDGNSHFVCGFDAAERNNFITDYDNKPFSFSGTGDLFSAFLTGFVLRGISFHDAVSRSVKILSELIKNSQSQADRFKGIPIEKYLGEIDFKKLTL